jgi:hypothetical protein
MTSAWILKFIQRRISEQRVFTFGSYSPLSSSMAHRIDIASCYATLQVSQVSSEPPSLSIPRRSASLTRPRAQSATLDDVKSSYKRLALKYHPDKNDSPDATAKFQEIGTAYKAIVDHIERPTPEPSWCGSNNNSSSI